MEDKVLYCIMLDLYGQFLTDRQRELADWYYNADMSLSEIAENANISRQGVHDAIKRAVKTLQSMEAKLGLARRELAIRASLKKCIELAGEKSYEPLIDELNRLNKMVEEQ
ncbi:MAG TPA: sigma factor-like helix-turn-helix DNA-binding protein [Clostridia bacterium]|nr:sigma factor-like helix-turn-helix DNA-binding protein [Clostridia bacterium]